MHTYVNALVGILIRHLKVVESEQIMLSLVPIANNKSNYFTAAVIVPD